MKYCCRGKCVGCASLHSGPERALYEAVKLCDGDPKILEVPASLYLCQDELHTENETSQRQLEKKEDPDPTVPCCVRSVPVSECTRVEPSKVFDV